MGRIPHEEEVKPRRAEVLQELPDCAGAPDVSVCQMSFIGQNAAYGWGGGGWVEDTAPGISYVAITAAGGLLRSSTYA